MRKKKYFIVVILTLLIIGVACLISFNKGKQVENTEVVVHNMEQFELKIKRKHFLKINKIVDENKKKRIFRVRKFFPALLVHNRKEMKVKIRLKGDWTDHLRFPKRWSFRIIIDDDNHSFLGMKRFSIQHPSTRHYLYEWLFIKILQDEGILAPRFSYANVKINGENWGVYAVEEFFGKELLESQKRRESVILKKNESYAWDAGSKQTQRMIDNNIEREIDSIPKIDAFQLNKIKKSPKLTHLFSVARHKLQQFQEKKLHARHVLDLEQWVKYFALSDLFQSHHGSGASHNRRYYYNPVTTLFEPIHFDGNSGYKTQGDIIGPKWNYFHDPYFAELYYKELERISRKEYIDSIHERYKKHIKYYSTFFMVDTQSHARYNWNGLYLTADRIKAYLGKFDPTYSFRARYSRSDFDLKTRELPLRISNHRLLSLELLKVKVKTKASKWKSLQIVSSTAKKYEKTGNYVLFGTTLRTPLSHQLKVRIPRNVVSSIGSDAKLMIEYRVLGSTKHEKAEVDVVYKVGKFDLLKASDINQLSNKKYLYLKDKNTLAFRKGKWKIKDDLIIPRGVNLEIESGTELLFYPQTVLVINGVFKVNGTSSEKVRIGTYTDNQNQGHWAGLIVMKAPSRSTIKHLILNGGKGIYRKGWESYGAITFYESDVDIVSSKFNASAAEDGINIIRSDFALIDCQFYGSSSDALDSDFSTGVIDSSKFINIGNDALDFSGSEVNIRNTLIEKTGDKGISAGEKSTIKVSNTTISKANIGIASKDSSQVHAANINIFGSRKCAFSVFMKKSEYGPASFVAHNLSLNNNLSQWLIEPKSKVLIDNKKIYGNSSKLKKQFYE